MKTVILIYGLPGAGKTWLAERLSKQLENCIWFNADKIRHHLCSDLGFTIEDRLEQARRLAASARYALENSDLQFAIVEFVCPTVETYNVFKQNLLGSEYEFVASERCPHTSTQIELRAFLLNSGAGRFADTNKMFNPNKDDCVILQGVEVHQNFVEQLACELKCGPEYNI